MVRVFTALLQKETIAFRGLRHQTSTRKMFLEKIPKNFLKQ